jgi:ankyrin repeat protein
MGWTSLHWAIKRMLDEVANALIILGADINIQNVDGNTPLHFAAMFENDSVLLCLLENNSLTDIRNRWGNIAADILRIKKHKLRICFKKRSLRIIRIIKCYP